MQSWQVFSEKMTMVTIHSKGATGKTAKDVGSFLLSVLQTPVTNGESRLLICEDLTGIDHCIIDLVDIQSTHVLICNVPRSTISSSNSAESSLVFPIVNAEASVAIAIEFGSIVLSEYSDSDGKSVHIRSPFGFSFVLVESDTTTSQRMSSLYLKAVFGDEIARAKLAHPPPIMQKKTSTSKQPISKRRNKKQVSTPSWDAVTGRIIPKLHPYLLVRDQYRLITANATKPIFFSDDIFEGYALFMVNSSYPMDDKFITRFAGDKNLFEVQVQGKFKKTMAGQMMYLGAEITRKMELGMLSKGICSSLLQFAKSLNPSLHHSYGDKDNIELPHIVAPFWTTVDRLVITSEGDTPPPFVTGFPELPTARSARKSDGKYHIDIDLTSTYSFSLKTHYIDLESWSVVGVPLMRELRLQTFWSDADIRFIAYFMDPTSKEVSLNEKGFPKLHAQSDMQRFFSMEIQNSCNHPSWRDNPTALYYEKDPANSSNDGSFDGGDPSLMNIEEDMTGEEGDMEGEASTENGTENGEEAMRIKSAASNDDNDDNDDNDHNDDVSNNNSDDDEDNFFDTQEDPALQEALLDIQNRMKGGNDMSTPQQRQSFSQSIPVSLAPSCINQERYLVPAAIEIDEMRTVAPGQRHRRTLYAFRLAVRGDQQSCVLRSYKEWKAALPMIKMSKKTEQFQRLSESEQRRCQLDQSYNFVLNVDQRMRQKVDLFLSTGTHTDLFLANSALNQMTAKRFKSTLPSFQLESIVCVRKGNYHWSQEYLGMTNDELIFVRPGKRLGNLTKVRIPLSSVLQAKAVEPEDCPLSIVGMSAMMIETFARQYLMVLRGESTRNAWIDAFESNSRLLNNNKEDGKLKRLSSEPSSSLRISGRKDQRNSSSGIFATSRDSLSNNNAVHVNDRASVANSSGDEAEGADGLIFNAPDLLAYPPQWILGGDKAILNARGFTVFGFDYLLLPQSMVRSKLTSAWELSAYVLELILKIFDLQNNNASDNTSYSSLTAGAAAVGIDSSNSSNLSPLQLLWLEFMNSISLLQTVDISTLDMGGLQAACIFLNLYHTLLLHAALIIGLPTTLFKWQSFFRNFCYEAFGDIFSLAELEHCIIRNDMSRPSINFIAQSFIPNTAYAYSLRVKDHRLLWAVNCASTSNLASIPVYRPHLLSRQLDRIMELSLEQQLVIVESGSGSGGVTITLPQMCQWYAKDFAFAELGSEVLSKKGVENKASSSTMTSRNILALLATYLRGESATRLKNILSEQTGSSKRAVTIKYGSFEFKCNMLTRLED